MVDIRPDRKGRTWIITRTDDEGFHHQLNLTEQEMSEASASGKLNDAFNEKNKEDWQ